MRNLEIILELKDPNATPWITNLGNHYSKLIF
jgi:hypothetical protein